MQEFLVKYIVLSKLIKNPLLKVLQNEMDVQLFLICLTEKSVQNGQHLGNRQNNYF